MAGRPTAPMNGSLARRAVLAAKPRLGQPPDFETGPSRAARQLIGFAAELIRQEPNQLCGAEIETVARDRIAALRNLADVFGIGHTSPRLATPHYSYRSVAL